MLLEELDMFINACSCELSLRFENFNIDEIEFIALELVFIIFVLLELLLSVYLVPLPYLILNQLAQLLNPTPTA